MKADMRIRYKEKDTRAKSLIRAYAKRDEMYQRGECTLTQDWFIENIFEKSCVYCGDSDWTHLGADRIDNTKPHTPDNCVCACGICNIEREYQGMTVDEFKTCRIHNPRFIDNQERQRKGFLKV